MEEKDLNERCKIELSTSLTTDKISLCIPLKIYKADKYSHQSIEGISSQVKNKAHVSTGLFLRSISVMMSEREMLFTEACRRPCMCGNLSA